ncbi:unnamed protein product [Ixodes pacificus]
MQEKMALHFLDDPHNYCCPLVDLFKYFRNTGGRPQNHRKVGTQGGST